MFFFAIFCPILSAFIRSPLLNQYQSILDLELNTLLFYDVALSHRVQVIHIAYNILNCFNGKQVNTYTIVCRSDDEP